MSHRHQPTPDGKLRHVQGWRPQRPSWRERPLKLHLDRAEIPEEVDLRSSGTPRIEDQSTLGSCTAQASTSAMEYLYQKMGQPIVQRSRLFCYYVSRVLIERNAPEVDSGCVISDVMMALRTFGCCSEEIMPYDPAKFSLAPTAEALADAQQHKILADYDCQDWDAVQHSLAEGYPVVFGFTVPQSMMSEATAKTGKIAMPGENESVIGGHCMLGVGYTPDYLICENSWGTDWGDHGYCYLPVGYFLQGYADDAHTIRSEVL